MKRIEHPLLAQSLGSQKSLVCFQFGEPDARPKAYIQASLHAEELPGMLVAHHLRTRLQRAQDDGRLQGQVVLVPAANPIGLAQRVDHHAQGRFEFGTSENFNRHYPDLAEAVWPGIKTRMGSDAAANIAEVRAAMGAWLEQWQPSTELESLRRRLMLLSHDADLVLDLHCDCESVLHMYCEDTCWPALEPLARLLDCRAVLLARDSGGGPFDERLSGVWWQLHDRLTAAGLDVPLPQACASTTVELRGEGEVSHSLALNDSQAIMAFMEHAGVIGSGAGEAPALPTLACLATPLAGSQTLRSSRPGVLVYLAHPGDTVVEGQVIAEVIDPTTADQSSVHEVKAGVAGILYAVIRQRYVMAGDEIGKIAGARPFRTGDLLGA
ncbi:succinylglutamate desuccinylase/aspartoacylase family protein [Hydrogenophaga sp.]|uniref:succinylglutamate desuccinylase/aspartoacylase family protein n=1 Tax=Hydrogenophaga sp. TaxID=1904254 RepID=UPI00272221E7|nr:succinylglutamate desuccinylase/aspartoacylase family protein [Hydrogenophaga sp.]MDO8906088.1 M14 family metallopeptidase [Hydrogenophaga sp.]